MKNKVSNNLAKILCIAIFFFVSYAHACGDNPNAIIQGPFKDKSFNDGYICFQKSMDGRDILFYLSYVSDNQIHNSLIDRFYYSDAPVELASVFFVPVNGERNVAVILRWDVGYENSGVLYKYYYEVRTYQLNNDSQYKVNLSYRSDPSLSGYQEVRNGKVSYYSLDNADKVKGYFSVRYNSVVK